jgi:23S rRNA (adenine2503-C2)-methyltransferase
MQRLLADTQVNLAVSLTAIDQDVRRRIMPVSKSTRSRICSRRVGHCRSPAQTHHLRVRHARGRERRAGAGADLARALAGIRCKVNLIPFNPFPGTAGRSDDVTVARFKDALRNAHVHATVRESRGPGHRGRVRPARGGGCAAREASGQAGDAH